MEACFIKLNDGWNADPNAPHEQVDLQGNELCLSFGLNRFQFAAREGERATLRFSGVSHYRLGEENDHAWYEGYGRYPDAPLWGEFYEVREECTELNAEGWVEVLSPPAPNHYLFYLRDSTFECLAFDWELERLRLRPQWVGDRRFMAWLKAAITSVALSPRLALIRKTPSRRRQPGQAG